MLCGFVPLLLALTARGETRIVFPNPIDGLTLSSRGNYLVAGQDGSVGTSWLANVRAASVLTKDHREHIVVSSDEMFATGMHSDRRLELTDLSSGKSSELPYQGPCVFSPAGHTMAFLTTRPDMSPTPTVRTADLPPADLSITLFDPLATSASTLSKYSSDIKLGIVKPTGVRLWRWSEQGIQISVSSPMISAAFVFYVVDPKTDRATSVPYGQSPNRATLIDGGAVEAAPMPDGMSILSRGPGPDYRFLFNRQTAGEPLKRLAFALAGKANRMIVWSASVKGDTQSLWLVHTITGQAKRLLQGPFDGKEWISYSISDDGERIAYETPGDPKTAIVIDAPDFDRSN